MKKRKKKVFWNIFIRYFILIALGVLPFYKILLPFTIWPVYLLLNLFYRVSVVGNNLFVGGLRIQIVDACVAGSAYYLLLILNLTTNMKFKKRLFSLLFSLFSLLILNILRIFFLSILFLKNFTLFDITHKLLWYALSIIFVIGIWFLTVWLFEIKNIPIYSDIQKIKKRN